MENTNESSLFDFSIDNIAANELNTAGKWAKRLAIVSITCIALVSIAFIFMGIAFADIFGNYLPREYSQLVSLQSSGIVFTIILLIIMVLVALYVSLLYKFGNNLIKATMHQDQDALEIAFNSFKLYLKITGILGIFGILLTLLNFLN